MLLAASCRHRRVQGQEHHSTRNEELPDRHAVVENAEQQCIPTSMRQHDAASAAEASVVSPQTNDDGVENHQQTTETPRMTRSQADTSNARAAVRRAFRFRLQSAAESLERLLLRYRASLTLLVAYCSFFWQVYDDAGKLGTMAPGTVPTPLSGAALLDPSVVEPLTRASVLSQSRLLSPEASGRSRVRAGLRREKSEHSEVGRQEEIADPIRQLETALRLAAASNDTVLRARLSSEAYVALGRLHSAHGRYYEMLHALALALRASGDAGDSEAVSDLHVALGHLELKHHRYYAAGTRFEDALQHGGSIRFANFTRVEALAGLGWSALMQSNLAVARAHFSEAFGGTSAVDAVISRAYGCRALLDGLDSARTLSLAGLAITSRATAGMCASGGVARSISDLVDCAASLFHGLPKELQEPHIWHALGLARYVTMQPSGSLEAPQAVAQRYHWRSTYQARCDSAGDLTACSHSVLHLGLLDFNRGSASSGMTRVETLLNLTGEVELEAAEWLIRFARAHMWAPSGSEFAAFLFGRAEPLLNSEGDARRARHLADHGRMLLHDRRGPSQLKQALVQLGRARDIVESAGVGWPEAEVAALYSSLGMAQQHVGKAEEAIESFERALAHRRSAVVAGDAGAQKLLLLSHANLAAARIEVAGVHPEKWRLALANLKDGRRIVREAGITSGDPIVESFEASFRNAMRLAHRRGVLATCPGPHNALLYGLQSPRDYNCIY